jgi:hypothetical protein
VPETHLLEVNKTQRMAGRPGFFGTRQGDADDGGAQDGFGPQTIRLGDPDGYGQGSGFNTPPGFDPVWGTLGAPGSQGNSDWMARSEEDDLEGVPVDVEIFGEGFQVSGTIRTGQFSRLSDWINMQNGFIQVRDAWHVHLGQVSAPNSDERKGTLWVRLDQVVLVAERSAMQAQNTGAPVVQKQKRLASIVAHGYTVRGNLFLHTYGSMKQFLESPDPHFLPMTELALRWLSDSALTARFPFAMINRQQVVTVLDESSIPANTPSRAEADEEMSLQRRYGAA